MEQNKTIKAILSTYRDKFGIIERHSERCIDFELVERPYDGQYEFVGYWKSVGVWITLAVMTPAEVLSFQ